MIQRNYPCDNIIDVYWGTQDFSQTGEEAFKRQLYQCLIGQALELKGDIEVRRSTNEWGESPGNKTQKIFFFFSPAHALYSLYSSFDMCSCTRCVYCIFIVHRVCHTHRVHRILVLIVHSVHGVHSVMVFRN